VTKGNPAKLETPAERLNIYFKMIIYHLSPRWLGVFCPRSWTYPLGLFEYQVSFDFAKDKQKETKFTCRRQETPPRR